MQRKPSRQGTSTIAKFPILRRQLILWLVMAVLAWMVMLIDAPWGLSLMWGISVCFLPAACFSWYANRHRGARAAPAVVNGFYRAETVKFVLTVILFAAVFQQVNKIYPIAFFLAFVVAQICSWMLIALTVRRPPH